MAKKRIPEFGVPASFVILDRVFGEAGKLVKRHRGSLYPEYFEVMIFLKGSYDLTSHDINAIPAKDVESTSRL